MLAISILSYKLLCMSGCCVSNVSSGEDIGSAAELGPWSLTKKYIKKSVHAQALPFEMLVHHEKNAYSLSAISIIVYRSISKLINEYGYYAFLIQ